MVGCEEKAKTNESIKGTTESGTKNLDDKKTDIESTKRVGLMVGIRTGQKYSTYYFA